MRCIFRAGARMVTGIVAVSVLAAAPARAAVDPETAFVLNTFSFLIHGAMVMLMAAGFAMLESGLVRSKNTAAICLKNISLYALAGVLFHLVGYSLMYNNVDGGWIGTLSLFHNASDAEMALVQGDGAVEPVLASGYATMSDWFFQMVFVATAASIVSGTLAERIGIGPFLLFVAVLSALIYPVAGAWHWGGGFLAAAGFSDFAGSTIVHSVGGWAALTGALILGPRRGKYGPGGKVNPIPGANLPLATLGTFFLWFGWFGFNGGSQLALGGASDAIAIAGIYANTNLGAAGGVLAAMLVTRLLYGKIDLTVALNGAIAGLVSVTAGPDFAAHQWAVAIGGVGGALAALAIPLLDRLRIDDVVGAIPAHLVAGIWGTLAAALVSAEVNLLTQLYGIAAIGLFTVVSSALVWLAIRATIGLRVDSNAEATGLDKSELGLEAYPEFGSGSQRAGNY